MSDITIKRIDELSTYAGEHAIAGIRFHPAAKDLGVTAWAMAVLELSAGNDLYPEHDHVADGQEEVYVLLEGSATLHVGGEEWALERGTMVRVGPGAKRKFVAGPEGATVLAIGSTPGKAYTPRG